MPRKKPKNAKYSSREGREDALALLFEWSFGHSELSEIVESSLLAGRGEPDGYGLLLAEKAVQSVKELDGLIEQYSQGWKLSRLSRTLLTMLRIAFCEMTQLEKIPAGVSISEAVEILKKYGTAEEAAYLNGVLGSFDQVRRGLKPEPPKPSPAMSIEDIQSDEQNIQTEQSGREIQEVKPDRGALEITDDEAVEMIEGLDVEI